jgi:hypothetical protein
MTKVPSKIRVFAWRLARFSLPTGDALNHREMATVPSCSLCGVNDAWKHSLIECTMALCVWALMDEDESNPKPSAMVILYATISQP